MRTLIDTCEGDKEGSEEDTGAPKGELPMTMVFANTIKSCEAVTKTLQEEGLEVLGFHHGLEKKVRCGCYAKSLCVATSTRGIVTRVLHATSHALSLVRATRREVRRSPVHPRAICR